MNKTKTLLHTQLTQLDHHEEDAKEANYDGLLRFSKQHCIVDRQLCHVHALGHPQGGSSEPKQDRGWDDAHQRLAEVRRHVQDVRDKATDDGPLAAEVSDHPDRHEEAGDNQDDVEHGEADEPDVRVLSEVHLEIVEILVCQEVQQERDADRGEVLVDPLFRLSERVGGQL